MLSLSFSFFLPWQPVKNDNFGYGREKANCLRRSWAPKVISCSLRRNHYRRDHLMNGINTGRSSLGLIISKRENKLSKAIGACDILHPKYYMYVLRLTGLPERPVVGSNTECSRLFSADFSLRRTRWNSTRRSWKIVSGFCSASRSSQNRIRSRSRTRR